MPDTLPPHPVLGEYYGDASQRERFVRNIFDETAEWYDDIIGMLSFGSGNRYRKMALARAGLTPGMRLLDLATGTGVVARASAGVTDRIVTSDASIGMLLAGRSKHHLPLVQNAVCSAAKATGGRCASPSPGREPACTTPSWARVAASASECSSRSRKTSGEDSSITFAR